MLFHIGELGVECVFCEGGEARLLVGVYAEADIAEVSAVVSAVALDLVFYAGGEVFAEAFAENHAALFGWAAVERFVILTVSIVQLVPLAYSLFGDLTFSIYKGVNFLMADLGGGTSAGFGFSDRAHLATVNSKDRFEPFTVLDAEPVEHSRVAYMLVRAQVDNVGAIFGGEMTYLADVIRYADHMETAVEALLTQHLTLGFKFVTGNEGNEISHSLLTGGFVAYEKHGLSLKLFVHQLYLAFGGK